jgi:hypothetical protein
VDTQIEESRETVEQHLARRHRPKSYQEAVQYALDLVDMHLHEENPDRIDECIKLYADDAVWEPPARGVAYQGRETIKKMYVRVFDSAAGITFHPIERFATPERVFDDMWTPFCISGDGFENCPFPIGTMVKAVAAQLPHPWRPDRQGDRLLGLAARRIGR